MHLTEKQRIRNSRRLLRIGVIDLTLRDGKVPGSDKVLNYSIKRWKDVHTCPVDQTRYINAFSAALSSIIKNSINEKEGIKEIRRLWEKRVDYEYRLVEWANNFSFEFLFKTSFSLMIPFVGLIISTSQYPKYSAGLGLLLLSGLLFFSIEFIYLRETRINRINGVEEDLFSFTFDDKDDRCWVDSPVPTEKSCGDQGLGEREEIADQVQ